jgi:hypothetical protein
MRRLPLHRLRRLRALRAAELGRLLYAQGMLVWAALLVRTRPQGRLISVSERPESGTAPNAAMRRQAHDLALAVERAAEHGVFRPACLVRSVALHRMLRACGIAGSRIHIGVRLQNGTFVAHAWVEWNGEILGDVASHVGTFAPLCDVELAGAP